MDNYFSEICSATGVHVKYTSRLCFCYLFVAGQFHPCFVSVLFPSSSLHKFSSTWEGFHVAYIMLPSFVNSYQSTPSDVAVGLVQTCLMLGCDFGKEELHLIVST